MPLPAKILLAGVCAAIMLGGCSWQSDDADSLFPLAPGLSWQYRVKIQRVGAVTENTMRVMENISRSAFAGEDGVAIRRNEDGIRYYVARRDDGFYRVAVKSLLNRSPIMDQPAVRILPLPARPGTRWREPVHTYLLDRAKTFITDKGPDNTIALDYHIEADDVGVKVPAGEFSNCVLAIGRTTFHLGSGVGFAPTDIPIEQREWYCPGVGLVRLIREETLTSAQRTITGGRIELTLVSGPR